MLTLLILALWQAIGSWTQGVAVSPPLQTLAYLFDLVRTSMFWDHAAATLAAFLLAFALSALIGLALGLIFGVQRFTGEVAEPILAGFYTIPKVTLYPVVLLDLRPRHVCQGRLRRHARAGADDPVHARRGAQSAAGADPDGQGAAAFARPHHAVGVGARLPAGDRQRSAHQLFADACLAY